MIHLLYALKGDDNMRRFVGIFYLIGAYALAGTSVISARIVSKRLGIFTIVAFSLFFAIIALLPVCGKRIKKTIRLISLRDWIWLMLQAIFGIFLFRMFLLKGLEKTSAGEAGILIGAAPAITSLLAWIILKEQIHKNRIFGLVITVTGVLMIQGIWVFEKGFSEGHFVGNLLVLGAATCESLFNVISRISSIRNSASKSDFLDPVIKTTIVSGFALLFCIGPALSENPLALVAELRVADWMALIWYGIIITALAFILWYAGIKRCEASTAAVFSGMMPLTALVLSVLILREQPVWQQWVGTLMIVTGMVLSGQKRL